MKSEIKRRQRAFVADDMPNYQALKLKVMELIRDAKLRFYENKTANLRSTDPSKWFKSIYRLCGDGGSANQVPSSENLAENLQEAFTRPWRDFTPKSNQHAFAHGRSTLSALINISQNWFNDTNNKLHGGRKSIHALFVDFSKAFDLVDHSVLLNKLKQLNINTSLWLWIQSFLTDRTQQVKLPGALPTKSSCPAGVPQGSVISPLLFNITIDDIDDAIPANLHDRVPVCKYADDCTFYESISTNDESSMQVVLNSIHEWTTSNHMQINSKKIKDMFIDL